MSSRKTKYSRNDRKYIMEMIEGLKNNDDYKKIFNILNDDPANIWVINSNEVTIDLSIVSDSTLDKITRCLKKVNNKKNVEIDVDTDIIPVSLSQQKNRTYKLSNYEQNIIKQRNMKKVMNNEREYEELDFKKSSQKKSSNAKSR
jgi:hypothetical protein